MRMSAFDAVDGSSTGTEVPWTWVLLSSVALNDRQFSQIRGREPYLTLMDDMHEERHQIFLVI